MKGVWHESVYTAIHDLSEYDQIVSDLAGQRTPIHIDGCIDSQKCHLISSIGEPYPFKLIVTYNEIKAKEIYEDYRFFDRNVYYLSGQRHYFL